MRLGHVRIEVTAVQAIVAVAGLNLESGTCRDPREVATLARSSIAAGVERVIAQIRRLAGPAPTRSNSVTWPVDVLVAVPAVS